MDSVSSDSPARGYGIERASRTLDRRMSSEQPAALVVLVAAGNSTRMGSAGSVRKPLLELAGSSLLELACATFDACPSVTAVVIVAHPDDRDTIAGRVADRRAGRVEAHTAFAKVRAVVPGGAERTDSVRCGASVTVPERVNLISVHDAARPLVTPQAIERVHARAQETGAALLALPVRDTLKHSTDGEQADRTVERKELWAAQTPQVFEARRFRELLARAGEDGFRPTDDAALWERYVGPVALVPGEATNFKITLPADLEIARAVLAARQGQQEDPRT